MGVLTDDNGFIKRVNFYPDNVSEPSTLEDIESDLQAHPQMVVIMDAGIATVENIERLAEKKIGYLCVVRSPEVSGLRNTALIFILKIPLVLPIIRPIDTNTKFTWLFDNISSLLGKKHM